MLGWIKQTRATRRQAGVIWVTTTAPASDFTLRLDTGIVDSTVPKKPDGTLSLPAEAGYRS